MSVNTDPRQSTYESSGGSSAGVNGAQGPKQDGTKEESITKTDSGLTYTKFLNGEPFNARSKAVRAKVTGDKLVDLKVNGIISTLLTTGNKYYLHTAGGGYMKSGYTSAAIKRDNDYSRRIFSRSVFNAIPNYMILPNCVGGARGRYQELIGDEYLSKQIYGGNPPGIAKWGPFSHDIKTKESAGYKQVGTNFWLWVDKDGTYGPKGGTWGRGYMKNGAPALPGAFVIWHNNKRYGCGHIEFIEAVYNFGQKNEKVYCTASAYGHYYYSPSVGVLNLCTLYGSKGSYWRYSDNRVDGTYLYTPLCTEGSAGGNIFENITINYTDPTPEQEEAMNNILEELGGKPVEYTRGTKVCIDWLGNQKKDGTGKKVNKVNGVGWIKKIHASGLAYPYEVVDQAGKTIGFYKKGALRVI